jgi:hypothetical protein
MDWAWTPAPFHYRAAAGVFAAAAQRLGLRRDIATSWAIAAKRSVLPPTSLSLREECAEAFLCLCLDA